MLECYGQSLAAYSAGDKPRCIALLDKSLRAADDLFAALHQAEYGKWSRWFIGERSSAGSEPRPTACAVRGTTRRIAAADPSPARLPGPLRVSRTVWKNFPCFIQRSES